jgi:hypothetical protein
MGYGGIVGFIHSHGFTDILEVHRRTPSDGFSDCDTPLSLVNATFDWLKKEWADEIDFVICEHTIIIE